MLTAAIYVRKSTDQSSVSENAKSVTRQIEHAKAYASPLGNALSPRPLAALRSAALASANRP